jgi:hypothetical protein
MLISIYFNEYSLYYLYVSLKIVSQLLKIQLKIFEITFKKYKNINIYNSFVNWDKFLEILKSLDSV